MAPLARAAIPLPVRVRGGPGGRAPPAPGGCTRDFQSSTSELLTNAKRRLSGAHEFTFIEPCPP